MRNYRFELQADIGGFLWWAIIKFGKTKLEDEKKVENAPRNILIFYSILIFIGFIVVRYS